MRRNDQGLSLCVVSFGSIFFRFVLRSTSWVAHFPDSVLRSDLIYIHDFIYIDIMSQRANIREMAYMRAPSMLCENFILVDYAVAPRLMQLVSPRRLIDITQPTNEYSAHLPPYLKSPFHLKIMNMVNVANANGRTLVIALIRLGMYEPAMVVSCIPKLALADEEVTMVLSEEVKDAVAVLHGDTRTPTRLLHLELRRKAT